MKIKVDGKMLEVSQEKSLLVNLKEHGYPIPSICYQDGLEAEGRCRLCVVEIAGRLVASCQTYPTEGMEVATNNERVNKARRINAELLLSEHTKVCFSDKDGHELCDLISKLGLEKPRFDPKRHYKVDLSASVVRDNNKCINCGRCVQVCANVQATHAIGFADRSDAEHVTPYSEKDLSDVACIKCGQCIAACPVGAISEREHLSEVLKVLANPKKHVIVQTAPSIRAALGEEFGMPPGTLVTGKMVAALRRCGFDKVFDTNLGADITIMEEASEFLERVKAGGIFPMITTCCPAWIKFMEHFYHDLIPHMSTCKSPHEMLGNLTNWIYSKETGLSCKDIIVVSIMPCTAKKFESTRPELESDVDYVLTTRELARLIRWKKIDFLTLPDEKFDPALGISTGAAAMFGVTGGVMEAALRTVYEFATGKKLEKVEFDQLRGNKGIKTGSIMINGTEIKFAAANGLANAKKLIAEKDNYHFIEIMACPGGCIGGGGQPLPINDEIRVKRMEAIYAEDKNMSLRKSHENPIVKKIYDEYLIRPGSEEAHKHLHTTYTKRSQF